MRFFQAGLRCVLAIAVAATTNAALAQATNSGDIRGTVTDATGALLPDVTVTVVNTNTGHYEGVDDKSRRAL